MNKISNIDELTMAIEALEVKKTAEGLVVKEHFILIQNELSPSNLLINGLKGLISSKELKHEIVDVSIGAAAGYLVKKVTVADSQNIFQKMLSIATQSFVSAEVAKNGEQIRTWVSTFLKKH
jgi:hypothetical protein